MQILPSIIRCNQLKMDARLAIELQNYTFVADALESWLFFSYDRILCARMILMGNFSLWFQKKLKCILSLCSVDAMDLIRGIELHMIVVDFTQFKNAATHLHTPQSARVCIVSSSILRRKNIEIKRVAEIRAKRVADRYENQIALIEQRECVGIASAIANLDHFTWIRFGISFHCIENLFIFIAFANNCAQHSLETPRMSVSRWHTCTMSDSILAHYSASFRLKWDNNSLSQKETNWTLEIIPYSNVCEGLKWILAVAFSCVPSKFELFILISKKHMQLLF